MSLPYTKLWEAVGGSDGVTLLSFFFFMSVAMTFYVKQSSASSPIGYRSLLCSYACVLAVVFVIPEASTKLAASILCAFTTFLAVYSKLTLRPTSVFLLAVASVILNTYAVGYGLSFKYAVVISPLLAMVQAFLSLPFQVQVTSENQHADQ